jgi:AcrR family transcriptional regulator
MAVSSVAIVDTAEAEFDRHGFHATGVDRLARATGVSTRTLYAHLGSKDALVTAVLRRRAERFFAVTDAHGVDELFALLDAWVQREGARGCLFLRAEGELRDTSAAAVAAIADYRRRLRELVRDLVTTDLGRGDDALTEQVLVLFEGATAAATYRGRDAVTAARRAAAVLLDHAR